MLARKKMDAQSGFSLVEMMIAVTVGLVVLAGVAQIFASTVSSNGDALKMARVNQDLRAAMDVMIRDIQRAGYYSQATATGTGVVASTANPFTLGVNDLQVSGSCITYTYDRDNDAAVNDRDKFAFYLSDGAILMRNAGDADSNSCTPNSEGITDSNRVKITALSIVVTSHCINVTNSPPTDCATTAAVNGNILVKPRHVNITITGQPAGDTDGTMMRTITNTVHLRNDLVCSKGSTQCP